MHAHQRRAGRGGINPNRPFTSRSAIVTEQGFVRHSVVISRSRLPVRGHGGDSCRPARRRHARRATFTEAAMCKAGVVRQQRLSTRGRSLILKSAAWCRSEERLRREQNRGRRYCIDAALPAISASGTVRRNNRRSRLTLRPIQPASTYFASSGRGDAESAKTLVATPASPSRQVSRLMSRQ